MILKGALGEGVGTDTEYSVARRSWAVAKMETGEWFGTW